MLQLLFLVIAGVGLLAALGVVLSRNLVHAALYLVVFFLTVACHFVLLEAEFLAALQVLVYIGAVAIILMFGIMLTRNIQGDDTTILGGGWRFPALIAGGCVFGVLAFGINNAVAPAGQVPWSNATERPSIGSHMNTREANERRESINNMGKVVGNELMTRYVVGFEVAGLLLTAALVGAIALAYRSEDESEVAPGDLAGNRRGANPADPRGASGLVSSAAGRTPLTP